MRADPRLQVSAQSASIFLERLAQARKFFAPIIDNERRPPEYMLVVGEGDLARTERWTYGEPVRVLALEADSTGMQPDVTVTGPWSALQAAGRSGIEPVRLFHPDTRAELPLPIFPSSAPEIAAARRCVRRRNSLRVMLPHAGTMVRLHGWSTCDKPPCGTCGITIIAVG